MIRWWWAWLGVLLVTAGAWADELNGRVLRPDGQPAARARLAWEDCWCGDRHETTADEQGRFHLDNPRVINGMNGTVVAWDDQGQGLLPLDASACQMPVTITLRSWVQRTGRLLTPEGQPVAGAVVTVTGLADPLFPWLNVAWPQGDLTCTTSADGAWRFDRWPPLGAWVEVTHPTQRVIGPAQPDGHARGDWTVRLAPPTVVSGRVTDRQGRALAGCTVTIRPAPEFQAAAAGVNGIVIRPAADIGATQTVRTDAQGRYRSGHLRARYVQVGLDDPTGPALTPNRDKVPLAPSATTAGTDLVGEPGMLVTLVATDAATGAPIPDVAIIVGEPQPGSTARELRTGADGRLQMRCLPGPYQLTCHAPQEDGWARREQRLTGTLAADRPTQELPVRFERGRDVAVTVVDDQDRPVAGVGVYLLGPSLHRMADTDDAGRCTLRAVPHEGQSNLHVVEPSEVVRAQQTVDLATWSATAQRVVVPALARTAIAGRVLDKAGQPVVHAPLRIDAGAKANSVEWYYRATTDAEGRYALSGPLAVPRGGHFLVMAGDLPDCDPDGVSGTAAGEQVTLPDLVLKRRAGRAAGRVVDAAGQPLAGALVSTCDDADSHPPARAWSDDEGRFALANLRPGPIRLVAGRGALAGEGTTAADGGDLTITVRPVVTPSRDQMRDAAEALLMDIWTTPTHDNRCQAAVPTLLAEIDPGRAVELLAALDPHATAGRALLEEALPGAVLARPTAMLGALRLADALDASQRTVLRLTVGLALAAASEVARAGELLDQTPVPPNETAEARDLRAFLAAQLDRPGAIEALRRVLTADTTPAHTRQWLFTMARYAGRRADLMDATLAHASPDSLRALRRTNIVGLARLGAHAAAASAALRWMGASFDEDAAERWLPALAARPGGEALLKALPAPLAADARLIAATLATADAAERLVDEALCDTTPDWLIPLAAEAAPIATRAWLDALPAPSRGVRPASRRGYSYVAAPRADPLQVARALLDPGLERSLDEGHPQIVGAAPADALAPDVSSVTTQLAALALAEPRRAVQKVAATEPRRKLPRQGITLARWLICPSLDRWLPRR